LADFILAPELKPSQTPKESPRLPTGQTFEIILPNLIHKSKKRNLHWPAASRRQAKHSSLFLICARRIFSS